MKQKGAGSPEEHTRCLHPFLTTWEEREWDWGLSQAEVTEACVGWTQTLPTPLQHSPPLILPLPSTQAPFSTPAFLHPAEIPHPSPPSCTTSPHPSCQHTLTSWQKCPMPRILKEPVGCTFSHLRKTVVPATWDSAQLSSRGVIMWKCSLLACFAREHSIPTTTWRACRRTQMSESNSSRQASP